MDTAVAVNPAAANDNRRWIIADVATIVIGYEAQIRAIREKITEQRGRIKALGIKAKDFNFALRLRELEYEDRANAIAGIRECCLALDVGGQGDLFPAALVANGNGDEPDEDGADPYAEIAGPDSAAAARRRKPHKYPRSKHAGGSAADVLAEILDNDAA